MILVAPRCASFPLHPWGGEGGSVVGNRAYEEVVRDAEQGEGEEQQFGREKEARCVQNACEESVHRRIWKLVSSQVSCGRVSPREYLCCGHLPVKRRALDS